MESLLRDSKLSRQELYLKYTYAYWIPRYFTNIQGCI